jgi:hypothetical protein
MTIINDNSRLINKLEASLTDDARVVIYDRHMFIVKPQDNLEVFSVQRISNNGWLRGC